MILRNIFIISCDIFFAKIRQLISIIRSKTVAHRIMMFFLHRKMNNSLLSQLKHYTKVVADTGDFESMKHFNVTDATTNPSLILKAAQLPQYKYLVDKAKKDHGRHSSIDYLVVLFGTEISKIIDGRVSSEIDARLSFNTDGTIKKAREIIELYEFFGVSKERILIKIASTWEGILAAKILEKEGVHCNLTLLFSIVQAIACAEAGVKLVSPFVGRILDWYKKNFPGEYDSSNDPGVKFVTNVFNYYKHFGYGTEIMGASFRNTDEIVALAGCDLLTISPSLLEELDKKNGKLVQSLSNSSASEAKLKKVSYDENLFRFELNEDAMATEKLSEGIRTFVKDIRKLEEILR